MKSIFLTAVLLLAASVSLFGQNSRYDAPFPSVASSTSAAYLVANVPPNSPVLAVCNSPANQVPCTNYATTFDGNGNACPNGAQDTPQPNSTSSSCQSVGDPQGNIGFWAPAGTYDYTVCISNNCFGPYTVTLGGSGGGGGGGISTVVGTTSQIAVANPTTVPVISIAPNPILPGNVTVGTLIVTGASISAFSQIFTGAGGNSGVLAQRGAVSGTAISCFDALGNVTNVSCPPITASAAGVATEIQFRSSVSGLLNSDSGFNYNPTTHTMTVTNAVFNGTVNWANAFGLSTTIPITSACTPAAGMASFGVQPDGNFATSNNGSPCVDIGGGVALGTATQIPVMNAGSTAYVPQNKPVFDARDYGATGVGSGHDDLAAINSALTACSNTGGTVILAPTSASYYVTNSIHAVSNCTLSGQGGAKITIPAAGWVLTVGSGFGIVNIYQVSNFRVTGLHIVGNKTGADSSHSPKLIYLDPGAAAGAQNIQIDHNWLDTSAFEGIWVGCNACGGGVTAKSVDVSNNYFTGVGYGGANATQGLPAIQCNWKDGVVADNRLSDVGTGIGCSLGNSAITGNAVDGFQNQGIAVGDGGNYGGYSITGNTVEYTVTTSLAAPQTGYFIGGGSSGSNPVVQVSGNTCFLTGTVGQTKGRCFWGNTNPDSLFSGNVAEIHNAGIGFEVDGSTTGTTTTLVGNTCKFLNESDAEECFSAIPGGAGKTLTLFSKDNHAYGLTRANNSYGFDYNHIAAGTLNAYMDGDTQCCAYVRVGFFGGSDATPSSYDKIPLSFQTEAGVDGINPISLSQARSFREQAAPSGVPGDDLIWGDSTAHRLKMLNNNGTATNVLGASDVTLSLSGQFTSTLATGTAPFSVASTTRVSNLDTSGNPNLISCGATSTCANTQQLNGYTVYGKATLAAGTLAYAGLPFASTTWLCNSWDITTPGTTSSMVQVTDATHATITGTGTDVIGFQCLGN